MPFFILIFALFIAGYVGRSVFRRMRLKGHGKFFSELIGAMVGFSVFFCVFGGLMHFVKESHPSSPEEAIVAPQKNSLDELPSSKKADLEKTEAATALEASSAPQKQTESIPVEPLLDYDSKTFQKRFNQAAKTSKSNLRCESLNLETGAVNDSFIASVTENIALIGSIDKKTQQLQSVTMIAQGDGSIHSGANIMLGIGQLIMATAPELDAKGRGQLLKDMGLTPENLKDGKEGRHVIGNKKFFFSMSDLIGLWFGVEAVEPKGKP